jgi:lysylphosphatidylglycerol synthetase-like protein (DUF2156 family)
MCPVWSSIRQRLDITIHHAIRRIRKSLPALLLLLLLLLLLFRGKRYQTLKRTWNANVSLASMAVFFSQNVFVGRK